MVSQLRPAFLMLLIFTVITGVIYPLVVTAVAQVVFPHQANGSLIVTKDGKTSGSELIGQQLGRLAGARHLICHCHCGGGTCSGYFIEGASSYIHV
jgi:K+-transporting ATPase c subunit